MNILETIIKSKISEVADKKSLYPTKLLEKSIYFDSPCVSLKEYIGDKTRSGIIAEFKRRSPSKGDINKYALADEVTLGYMQAGASALSVLTDEKFFGAKKNDLQLARKFNYCPILRKDFIIDAYQIIEAKSIGADAILLIARILNDKQLNEFIRLAHSLEMEVLVEINSAEEVPIISDEEFDLVGINNRNLETFKVDLENSFKIVELLPLNTIKIAESGIQSPEVINHLAENGFDGFLIGEYFMRSSNPAEKCKELIKQLEWQERQKFVV